MRTQSIIGQRNDALKAAHRQVIRASDGIMNISRQMIISIIKEMPAPRFYISPFTARLYINNNQHCREKSRKPDMVADLIENFNRLKHDNPNAPLEWLYEVVVEQPAKSFYMSSHRIEEIIFNYTGRNGTERK
jgi:hypothetical protein